jgi:hypothetical protein
VTVCASSRQRRRLSRSQPDIRACNIQSFQPSVLAVCFLVQKASGSAWPALEHSRPVISLSFSFHHSRITSRLRQLSAVCYPPWLSSFSLIFTADAVVHFVLSLQAFLYDILTTARSFGVSDHHIGSWDSKICLRHRDISCLMHCCPILVRHGT